ncbi:hypothetical protein F5Y13DRAFT_151676 [Hypoxylon sp. FL1857]|nr:hypothetical protein F5Y13DRAFT_151676 [Hypoxylon sp. FL1857]
MRNEVSLVHWLASAEVKEEEEHQRLGNRVYVMVPDKNDHSKPWPKNKYPDLKTALTDLCIRFKPYYAPFAAYINFTCTIQLFPPNFKPPTHFPPISGSTMFTLQNALDNWDSTLFSRSLLQDEEETEDSINVESTLSMTAESGSTHAWSSLNVTELGDEDLDEGVDDDDTLDSDDALSIAKDRLFPELDRPLSASELEWSDETLIDDDDNLTIPSPLGFLS